MSRIANKGYCNMKAAENVFIKTTGEKYPTYKEILETEKFTIANTYENNQLVKESDITKYNGKIINHTIVWGEWDSTKKIEQVGPYTYLNLRIRQNFLKAPDTNLKITISLRLTYKNDPSLDTFTPQNKTLTVNFTQASGNDKKYAYSQDFAVTLGNSASAQLGSITITNVSIEPTEGASQYEYITNIKDITQNYFVELFSVTSTAFYIDSYNDDTTNKIITNKCKISPKIAIPTGTAINNIDVYIDNQDYNYTIGKSNATNYNTSYSIINYEFTAIDKYGERGYKLPYFYTKFALKQKNTNYTSYVYALWEPDTTQSGIELTNLIAEE